MVRRHVRHPRRLEIGLVDRPRHRRRRACRPAWPRPGSAALESRNQDDGRGGIKLGGEVGILTAWWNATDRSEWRWQVEFSNHR
ncbi:MAG: hypothetical protein ACR2JY_16260 [Chloroflexota bacterium]